MRWRPFFIFSLLLGACLRLGAGEPDQRADLQLNDGRLLKSARIITVSDKGVTVIHSGGIEVLPADSIPLEVLGRAYPIFKNADEKRAGIASDIAQKETLRASKKQLVGDTRPPALIATGDFGPKTAVENGCIIASNAAGTGTAFILRQKDKFVLVSNQHVIDGPQPHRYDQANGATLKPTGGIIATDRDIVVFELQGKFENYFELEPNIEKVALGEQLLIYGNSLGEGLRVSHATLVAKGRAQIEVSGGMVAGNSGGPIIREKTGRVIGVSTFIRRRDENDKSLKEMAEAISLPKVQFYGVRIDTLSDYTEFNLRNFLTESANLDLDRERLLRAIKLLALMSVRIEHSIQLESLAHDADPVVLRTVAGLQESKFYPGTFSPVDISFFRRNADPFFADISETRAYIHRERRLELMEDKEYLVSIYRQLLRAIPTR